MWRIAGLLYVAGVWWLLEAKPTDYLAWLVVASTVVIVLIRTGRRGRGRRGSSGPAPASRAPSASPGATGCGHGWSRDENLPTLPKVSFRPTVQGRPRNPVRSCAAP